MNRKLFLYAVLAQLLICVWILLKVFLLPYLVWKWFGTSSLAGRVGDLSVLGFGTFASLCMGAIGYLHAARYPKNRSRLKVALISMCFVHLPLYLFLAGKWLFGSAWDTFVSLYLSGWLSIVTHPMILVGFYGKWVDFAGALLFGVCYLTGVWMYFDEKEDDWKTRARSR